jgi:hypothetical protein
MTRNVHQTEYLMSHLHGNITTEYRDIRAILSALLRMTSSSQHVQHKAQMCNPIVNTYFPNVFSAILHISLALRSIYC